MVNRVGDPGDGGGQGIVSPMSDLPGPLAPTTTTTIGGLYAEQFLPAGTPRGVVVITHGYAEHCGRYREVAHVIVRAGFAALSYDVRGHGQSPGPRGFIERFETYLDDLAAMVAAGRALAGGPVVLLGHSHGGLITLRALAGEAPPAVTTAIVSSPYLGLRLVVPGYKKLLAMIASRVAPRFAQPASLRPEDLTTDVEKQAERRADTRCFDTATARWFTESSAAQAFVAERASRIAVPTTWLVGADDPIADPARSRTVAAQVAGARYHDLLGMKHEVFNERARASVFAHLTAALATA